MIIHYCNQQQLFSTHKKFTPNIKGRSSYNSIKPTIKLFTCVLITQLEEALLHIWKGDITQNKFKADKLSEFNLNLSTNTNQ